MSKKILFGCIALGMSAIMLIAADFSKSGFGYFGEFSRDNNSSNSEVIKTKGVKSLQEYVSESDVEKLTYFKQNVSPEKIKDKQKAKDNAINELVDRYAIYLEAKEQGLNVSDDELQKTIDFSIENAKKVENQDFKDYLDGLDMTIEEYYNEYTKETLRDKLLENKLIDKVTKNQKDPKEKMKRWNEEKEKITNTFKKNNSEKIKNLKNNIKKNN
ncbi:SurA N-terminal domain-containing protein [Rossellomorea aquimaris]|uniref:Uncharacterized protein n=1 Tax=Rossellomorea aquimaris TaxID=189382 RepID=A0A1J6W6G4_9BACI|nr:SurA N-terminal domain-containing protein [Rossellomorea aquimaris]OIU73186.1 hypothetical protein BHE18_15020 [Rossellomorea aquimaris]